MIFFRLSKCIFSPRFLSIQSTIECLNVYDEKLESILHLPEHNNNSSNNNTSNKFLVNLSKNNVLKTAIQTKFSATQDVQILASLQSEPEQDSEVIQLVDLISEVQNQIQSEIVNELCHFNNNSISSSTVFLETRPGIGGEEACLFAKDLFKMYQAISNKLGWTYSVLETHKSKGEGYKLAIARIDGENCFKQLSIEGGIHRVQRIPTTEKSDRIHTSTAAVEVLPAPAASEAVKLQTSELKIETMRASGPGGQSVNMSDTAVKITHVPSGIVVKISDRASQSVNRAIAMAEIKNRLEFLELKNRKKRETEFRQVESRDRSAKIRSYSYPRDIVLDHRTGVEIPDLGRFLSEGEGLEELWESAIEKERLELFTRALDLL